MTRLLWLTVFVLMLLSGCGWNGSPSRNNDFTPLTSIEIKAVSSTIAAHTSTKLTVIGNFSGLFTRDITSQAVWSSGSSTVADFITPSNPNRVTGLTPGSAVLTATVGKVSNTFTLTVSNATITTVTITPADPSIPLGLTVQFAAQGTFSDTTTQDITFDATWASSAPAIATVSDAVSNKGFAQSLAVGETTISATLDGVPGSTLLTVTAAALQSITVTPSNPSVLSLSSTSFKATGNYSNGTTADLTSKVAWTSSQANIATITSSGAVTTLASGTTTITAALSGVKGTSSLNVTGGNLTNITISPANSTMATNTVARITATGTFSNGATRDITSVVTWSVANNAAANVAAAGGNLAWLSATAVTPLTTIRAQSGSVTNTTNLTVTAPALQSVSNPPLGTLTLSVGTSGRFVVTATFNGSPQIQDVTYSATWTSNNVGIATVGDIGLAKGRVTGVSAGTTTVSATYGGQTVTIPGTVIVTSPTIQSLTISGSGALTSGNQVAFTATANYFDGSSKDVTEKATWSIDKLYVAILADSQNQPGQVVGVNTGSATLTASFGGKTQTATITVP